MPNFLRRRLRATLMLWGIWPVTDAISFVDMLSDEKAQKYFRSELGLDAAQTAGYKKHYSPY